MDKKRSALNADSAQAARIDPLRGAVRRAIRLGSGVIATGLAIGAVATEARAPFPAVFELASLFEAAGGDGVSGFVLNGIDASDNSGYSVSAAGDINGDGIDDLIIGAFVADPGGRTFAGQSYVVFGRDTAQTGNFPARFPLAGLLPRAGGDGSTGFLVNGIDDFDSSGLPVGAAGDVNGDGIGDLLIGAWRADPNGRVYAGETYVVFGRDTSQTGNFPARFPLASLLPSNGGDGTTGFVLNGIKANDFSGQWVSAAGDVNGDGIDDLLIGAPNADPGGRSRAGESYVVFGRNTAQTGNFPAVFPLASLLPGAGGDGSAGFVLNGIDSHDYSGSAVSAAGDVNGDGIDDLLIGAKNADPGGRSRAGESYVVFGRNTAQTGNFPAEFELGSLLPNSGGDGSAGFVLNGIDALDFSGQSVSAAGDVNRDEIGDLLISAWQADPGGRSHAGESYVVFGRDTAQAGNFTAEFELADLQPDAGGDGSAGFVLNGIDVGDYSGVSASGAGDVNGDGIGDVIIGALSADPGGRSYAGESYVVFGRDTAQAGNFPAVFPLVRLLPGAGGDGSAGFVLNGVDVNDSAGISVSAAGDVNGDGIDDLIIGARFADPGERGNAGESYVVFGREDDSP